MKKYAFLGLVLVALLAMTSVALAGGYATWVPGGSNGTSPHKDYSNATTKCKVCHAVHNAASSPGTPQTLLRSSRAEACIYCHLNPGTVSSLRPYGQGAGNEANYTSDDRSTNTSLGWYNHSSTHDAIDSAFNYNGCTSCHSVHGANTINAGVYILKNNPGLHEGGALGTVTNQRDFCRDCHDAAGGNITAGGCFDPGMSAGCHSSVDATISSTYFTDAKDGVTHIMTTNTVGNNSTTVAWNTSEFCYKCHAAGRPYAEGNSFPHYTPNAVQFTNTNYSAEGTGMDAACLTCHVEGGYVADYTTGVGKTF